MNNKNCTRILLSACFLVGLSSVLVNSMASLCTSTLLSVMGYNLNEVSTCVMAQEVSVFLRSAREKCGGPPSDILASCYCSLFCMGKQILRYFTFFHF